MTIKKVFYRSPHNYDLEEASNSAAVKEFGPSMTNQSHASDNDLEAILTRAGITGQMPQGIEPIGYGDFADIYDFRSAQDAVLDAQRRFNLMDAKVRARFNNDPQTFLEFAVDPENVDEMVKMGLAVKKPVPEVKPNEP